MKTPPPAPEPPAGPVPFLKRNFWAWVFYQFFFRTGWQFKMEATMVAGLISWLTPDQRMMGLFTTITSLARQSVPLFAAPQVDRWARKRSVLLLYWGAAVACWLVLTIFLWLPIAHDRGTSLRVFGATYTLFFVCLGAASVAQGALLGKIIPATVRGRAMAMGMGASGAVNVGAILALYFVITHGSFAPPRNYALAFSLTIFCFLMSIGALLAVQETPSAPRQSRANALTSIRYLVRLARENRNLRLLMMVNSAVAIGGSMLQFYTGFWRTMYPQGQFPEGAIIIATVFQVFWQSLSSAILGRVADDHGNRVLICSLLWIEALVPLVALVIGSIGVFRGTWAYLAVFALIGIRFPVFQLLVNYLLEALPQEEHAMGLGATNSIQILTAPAPFLLGWLARDVSYRAAFATAAIILFIAAFLALRLEEPRRRGADQGKKG